MEEDARQRVIRKFAALPEDKQQKLCDAMGELMAKLKADWEAKPENAGKTVIYAELWDEHAKVTGADKDVPPPNEELPPNRAGADQQEGKNSP